MVLSFFFLRNQIKTTTPIMNTSNKKKNNNDADNDNDEDKEKTKSDEYKV